MPVHPLYAMFQLNTAVTDLERFRGPPPDHIPAAGSAVLATSMLSLEDDHVRQNTPCKYCPNACAHPSIRLRYTVTRSTYP